MTDYLKRIFSQLVAGLLAQASRLVRLAALRQVLEEYTAALEEAAQLEARGQPALAKFLRDELDDTLGTTLTAAGPAPPPALNGDGHHPFSLPRPDTAASQAEGEGSPPPRRRGRPSSRANGAKAGAGEQPQEQAAEQADPTSSPKATPDHHL